MVPPGPAQVSPGVPPKGHAYAMPEALPRAEGRRPRTPTRTTAMAIFRLSVSKVSRADGRSAVAAAAYRSGEALYEERTMRIHQYQRRRGTVIARRLIGWHESREKLWNAAQAAESRKNSVEAREVQLALPFELPARRRKALAFAFAEWLHERYGVAIDVALHRPGRRGSDKNHHAHLLMTSRVVENGKFGVKTRALDDQKRGPEEVERMRAVWASLVNRALEGSGLDVRIDHRSHERMAGRGTDDLSREGFHLPKRPTALPAAVESAPVLPVAQHQHDRPKATTERRVAVGTTEPALTAPRKRPARMRR